MDLKEWAEFEKIRAETPVYTTPKGRKCDGNEFIYVLIDPRDNAVRYVGKTLRPLNRLREHISSSKNPYMRQWIAELRKEGLSPICKFIERTSVYWNERERFWIAHYLSQGANLLNMRHVEKLIER